ncbi:hypothetical protein C4544_05285 [candidate division WS5 bacterium]|uniref:Uncharacterized protein n=1 Tax=candidate division WS5 bacterium TaxID=2093353 RepID=A0A419DB53_9BACT|nr:MAG: hypothetical protein C4544_05285 [candidate division WS5 bacterium]
MERQNGYAHLFKRLSKSEIADMAVCALDTLSEEHQLEIFKKFFEQIDDRKKKKMFLNKIIGFIEGQKKMARADRWMETHMKNNPQEKPKIVAGRYVFIARIDNVKKDVYVALAQKIKNRLAKRRERNRA